MVMLKEGLLSWLQENEYKANIDDFPSKFEESATKCLSDQATIGWDAAMKGYFSVEWRYLASLGIADGEPVHEGRGTSLMRTVMKVCHEFIQKMWRSRNQVLHGSQEMEMKRIRQSEMAEIMELHRHPELVPAGDRHYCEQTVENILTRAPSTRRRWLRNMKQARLRFTIEGSRQSLITSYFRTGDNNVARHE
jgi:hypothetical protein